MKIYKYAALFVLYVAVLTAPVFSQKMKAEDILAKHLDSIGTAEVRANNTSRAAVGDAQVSYNFPKGVSGTGKIVIASAGEKFFWGINININNYPQEKFSFDGKKVKVSYLRNVGASVLGNFIQTNNMLVEESLLGGTLSTSWTLLNFANKKAKISYDGTKKIDGKETYVLEYSPKSGDLNIKMFFDKETFRHVRTEYKKDFPVPLGRTITESASQKKSYLKVVENFGDYKEEFGLTLPHSYNFTYSFIGQNSTTEVEWIFNLTGFLFNEKFDDITFDAEAN